jgi:hypothetical protein
MTEDKRFVYRASSQMVYDNLTGFGYQGSKALCDLLNEESDRADRIVEEFDKWYEVLNKYGIKDPKKLDILLFHTEVW